MPVNYQTDMRGMKTMPFQVKGESAGVDLGDDGSLKLNVTFSFTPGARAELTEAAERMQGLYARSREQRFSEDITTLLNVFAEAHAKELIGLAKTRLALETAKQAPEPGT
jgi:hypothetical protein